MVSGGSDRALQQRRVRTLALLAALMLALHVGLIDGMAGRWRGVAEVPSAVTMQVRTLLPVVLQAEAPPALEAAPAPVTAPPRFVQADRAARPEPAPPPEATPDRDAAPAVEAVPATAPAAPPPLPPVPARESRLALAPDEPLPEPGADIRPMPLPTREDGGPAPTAANADMDPVALPPAVALGYELRRGLLRGSAELRWEPRGDAYELNFDARVAGFSLLRQVSSGDLVAGGLAPRRFTDQRAGRDVRAANFQREAGKITFSGPGVELPLVPGAQDRLSWMVQLAAVVAADPRRGEPGGEVVMAVVGTRADLAGWVFRSVGPETVETPLGPVAATKFVRQRRDAFDTEVEVWLDPARHHLPVRAALHNGADDTLELLLRTGPLTAG